MYILRPFMDEVSSEEIVKKDNEMGGNISGGNFLSGNFPRGGFSRGEFDRWEFSRWWGAGGIFLEPSKNKNSWEYITMEI